MEDSDQPIYTCFDILDSPASPHSFATQDAAAVFSVVTKCLRLGAASSNGNWFEFVVVLFLDCLPIKDKVRSNLLLAPNWGKRWIRTFLRVSMRKRTQWLWLEFEFETSSQF